MSRLMSVAFTEQAVVERRKTVTRRKGWAHARPGMRLTLCRKVMGRRRRDGSVEPLVRLAEVEVVAVERQPLNRICTSSVLSYGAHEVAKEGFPGMAPEEFVRRFFVEAQGMRLGDYVNRIEWRYIEEDDLAAEQHPEDCPECQQGKHQNCTGWALDPDTDEFTDCGCAAGGHL